VLFNLASLILINYVRNVPNWWRFNFGFKKESRRDPPCWTPHVDQITVHIGTRDRSTNSCHVSLRCTRRSNTSLSCHGYCPINCRLYGRIKHTNRCTTNIQTYLHHTRINTLTMKCSIEDTWGWINLIQEPLVSCCFFNSYGRFL